MTTEIREINSVIQIINKGSRIKGIYFALLGLLFQILFVWGFWSFLDASGQWIFLSIFLVNSEIFPFISILFLFGGGCFLIALKEIAWREILIIQKDLIANSPGIQKRWQLLNFSSGKIITNKQIKVIRIHRISLDELNLFNRYQLEIDYIQLASDNLESLTVYSGDTELEKSRIFRLAKNMQEILNLTGQIEQTQSSKAIHR